MPAHDFNSECPFRRRWRPAVPFASGARGIKCGRRFLTGMNCFLIALFCGCTPPPVDTNAGASGPPARLQPTDPAPQDVTPATLHKRGPDKRGQHKTHDNKARQPDNLAAIEPSLLLGKEPSAVKKLLGDPADVSKRDVSLVWTYGSRDCAFQVYFYPDIKTSMFHALQYGATRYGGGKIDLSQGCIQRLLIMRK